MLTIVIPTLNAGRTISATLSSLNGAGDELAREVIVADGGSVDDTVRIADAFGAIVIEAPRGRGTQLAAGAAAGAGDWLLFLHGDTRLGREWALAVGAFMSVPGNIGRAGYFRFALDDSARAARILETVVHHRNRILALPYGDQGLLISRKLYEDIGGYRRIPLMEDVDLVRRIGRRRLALIDAPALTSAERYRREGYLFRPLRNIMCLSLYSLGVPPRYIVSLYG